MYSPKKIFVFQNFLWILSNADLTCEFLFPCFISYQSWQDPDICRKMFRKENVLTPNVFQQIILLKPSFWKSELNKIFFKMIQQSLDTLENPERLLKIKQYVDFHSV